MKSALLSKAKPLRKLEDGEDEAEDFEIDLTNYSIVFEKCQNVKFYNAGDNGDADDADGGDVLSTNKFVIFKLCNSGSCSSGCNYEYAEYVVDMDTYIQAMTQLKAESFEESCNKCEENCQADDAYAVMSDDCQACMNECDAYGNENLEENGMSASYNYIECAQVNGDDDTGYSVGAYCSDDGTKISIGVFSDQYCSDLISGKSAATILGFDGLDDYILSAAYSTDCISCLKEAEDDDQANADDYAPETQEVCQELYDAAGKCESETNFNGGYLQYYESQASNEETVCNFISSLDSGTYDQTGEIVIGDGGVRTVKGGSQANGGQKFILTVLILSTIGLAGHAMTLHQKITGGSSEGLSKQGGAMA